MSFVLMIALLNLFTSCSYYNVKQVSNTKEIITNNVNQSNQPFRYVIVHQYSNSWHLYDIKLNEKDQSISGMIQPLNFLHLNSRMRDTKSSHRYRPRKESPLDEVHFYLDNEIDLAVGKKVIIPFSKIKSISVNEKNIAKSTSNTILAVVGFTIGTLALLVIIVALTKSSCPFVYVDNGNGFDFVGELYPGVLSSNMQRDDFIPLPGMEVNDNKCKVKITNELLEIQYTDLAQLIVVDHPTDSKVLLDRFGNVHTISNAQIPKKVWLDDNTSDLGPAGAKDNFCYTFSTDIKNQNSARSIVFEFDKPPEVSSGKLFLTAKNSLWLDYVYGKFNEQFGSYFSKFQKSQETTSRDQKLEWLNEQQIPLSVYLKTEKGWELVDKINTVGPLAMRDLIVPISLKDSFGDQVQIKLETGFMFWEVDYIGMDFTENEPLNISYLEPAMAVDENSNDVTQLLKETDERYLVQSEVGNAVEIIYKLDTIDSTMNQSFFLKNRGYYTYIRDYKGIPDLDYLKTFRKSGSFTRFSEEVYHYVLEAFSEGDTALSHE
jgi:hypothetical protein